MNIFFYAGTMSIAGKHYLEKLLGLAELKNITILPEGSLFLSPLALELRSGDLIILFVADTQELDKLIALKNEFNDFRIILILVDSDSQTIRKAHLLQPSFITFLEEKTVKIKAVIKKITDTDMLLAQKPAQYG